MFTSALFAAPAPPLPSVPKYGVELVYWISLAIAVGVGLTAPLLAARSSRRHEDPSTGLADAVARCAGPAAVLVTIAGLLHFGWSTVRSGLTGTTVWCWP